MSSIRSLGYRGLAGLSRATMGVGLFEKGLRVLAYHDVADESHLHAQLSWLKSHFDVVALDEALGRLEKGRDLERAALVTFDDADTSVVDIGRPVLDSLGIEAVMFVCPGVVDTSEPYWWQSVAAAVDDDVVVDGRPVQSSDVARLKTASDTERREFVHRLKTSAGHTLTDVQQVSGDALRSWAMAGHSIGNHTWDHPLLDTCDLSVQEVQIRSAHTWLIDHDLMGIPVFAYPNGNHTDHAEVVLRDLGYRAAMLFDHRIVSNGGKLNISRLRVNSDDTMDVFISKMSGLHPAMHRLAGRR